MPSFAAANQGLTAGLTSGVDLLRGLALQTGVDLVNIPGVTDDGDNDYAGQMAGALAALADHDVVFVHVEAPDEASHAGDAQGKVRAIEQVDALMVPQLLDGALAGPYSGAGTHGLRVLVLPDHPTPLELKTHVAEPVPFVMWGAGLRIQRSYRLHRERGPGHGLRRGAGPLAALEVPAGLRRRVQRPLVCAAVAQRALVGHTLEVVLAGAAVWALPVVGQVFKRGPRSDVLRGVALLGVVDVSTQQALPFVHRSILSCGVDRVVYSHTAVVSPICAIFNPS